MVCRRVSAVISVLCLVALLASSQPPNSNDFEDRTPLSVSAYVTINGSDNDMIDFGFIPNGTIGDYVWIDKNHDGIQNEALDKNILPVKVNVTLQDASGRKLQEVKIDSNGFYKFTGLYAGEYKVICNWPPDYKPTKLNADDDDTIDSDCPIKLGDPVIVTITEDKPYNITIDFGFFPNWYP